MHLVLLCLALTVNAAAPQPSLFRDVEIIPPFDGYLKSAPVLMEFPGATAIRLPDGRRVVLAVASTVLKDSSPTERLRAEKVCQIKALASLVAHKQGVQIAHLEQLKELTVIKLENGKEEAASVTELLQVTQTRVEGIARALPVIGRWRSRDGKVFYLASGAVLDHSGEPDPAAVPQPGR